jgi:Domain of unknown function (DUF5666)
MKTSNLLFNPARLKVGITLTLVAAALSACGGGSGGGTAGSGSGTQAASSSVVSGQVTGFGSVIVEGEKFDDSAVVVKREDDASNPSGMSSSELGIGMKVVLKSSDGLSASSITVVSEAVGRITSLSTDGFVVAGQTVKISTDAAAPTVFDGVANLAGLAANDWVEVHGSRDAQSNIIATRIERKDPSLPLFVKVVGLISGLNPGAKTFVLSGLTVSYADTTRVTPTGTVLANGQRVSVWSDTAVSADKLAAKKIHVKQANDSGAETNDALRVGGPIRNLDFAAKTFTVDGLAIDATAAAFENGTVNDLAQGRRVRVYGAYANSKLNATRIKFVKNQGDALVELTGAITDFVSASSFKLRGVPVNASGTSIVFVNGTAADLVLGANVKIQGVVDSNQVKPSTITFVTVPGRGLGGPSLVINELEGGVYEFDAAAGTFKINGTVVKIGDTTRFEGVRENLRNGVKVEVYGTLVNGQLIASKVEIKNRDGEVRSSVRGLVSEFVSASSFRVNGQKVDASTARYSDGAAADLANGKALEVRGAVNEGVLKAVEVKFR